MVGNTNFTDDGITKLLSLVMLDCGDNKFVTQNIISYLENLRLVICDSNSNFEPCDDECVDVDDDGDYIDMYDEHIATSLLFRKRRTLTIL